MSDKRFGTGIVWFRQDLRLSDNPALTAACSACDRLIAIFIDDPADQTVSRLGQASSVWLHHSLIELDAVLKTKGQELVFAQGDSLACLRSLIEGTDCEALYWNRCYDPVSRNRDEQIKSKLGTRLEVTSFNGLLLLEPWELSKSDATPYRVFTPFWRKVVPQLPGPAPLPVPRKLPPSAPAKSVYRCASIHELELLPQHRWDIPVMEHWKPGPGSARKQLKKFIRHSIDGYTQTRNRPDVDGTSRLSPYLHFGEISARQVIHAVYAECADAGIADSGAETFVREIGWREFAYHLLFHFPATVSRPLDKRFDAFPWARANKKTRRAWETGRTGVPVVDAGMRQLWQTGWMHNRVRMIVGSYLVKNLSIPWQQGEQWFRDTLVDADLASNVMGWQWVAGSGADAAPFFRIFNPVLQGEKFDPEGIYVRRWVPELATVANKYIHRPWDLPVAERPVGYPAPLVDLKQSRMKALMAFDQIKSTSQ